MNLQIESIRAKTRNTFLVTGKELRAFFISPIAYIVITAFLVLSGILFFLPFFLRNQAEMRMFFGLLPWVLAIFVPFITMRLFAEEQNSGTFETLVTLPLTIWDIVIGKLLAAAFFTGLMLVPTFVYAVSILMVGPLDLGPVIGGYLGAFLMGLAYASVGVFASTLTSSQLAAVIISFTVCFALFFVRELAAIMPPVLAGFVEYLSVNFHFENISKGIIDLRNIVYFLSVTGIFTLASVWRVEERG